LVESTAPAVGGGANPRINGDVFVTDRLRCPGGLPLGSLGTDPGLPLCLNGRTPCKRWPSATAFGG
jgi:hypothetical protein